MPRKKVRIKKRIEPIESWVIEYFVSGKIVNPSSKLAAWELEFDHMSVTKNDLWKKHREGILEAFVDKNPGKRPWAWWEFDAPRWKRKFDAWFDGTNPEPRKRVGGTGGPDYEYLNYVPYFSYGIPVSYVDKFSEEYYNGRRRDVNGELIPRDYNEGDFKGVAFDPDDPPMFESQASYLKRHGLLTKSEEKRLSGKDFEPESCLKYIKTYKK